MGIPIIFYKNFFDWHRGGCLKKRAARLRLAVQAPATNKTTKTKLKGARKRAVAAEPLGDPPVFSIWQTLSFNAILYEIFICNWQRFLDTLKIKR